LQLGKEELGVCFFKAPPAPGTKEAPGILFVGSYFVGSWCTCHRSIALSSVALG